MLKTDSPFPASPASSETIELSDLEEIGVTPDSHHRHTFRQTSAYLPEQADSDDEDDTGDDGTRALLDSRSREPTPVPPHHRSVWSQIKNIVVEVHWRLRYIRVPLMSYLADGSYITHNHFGFVIHRGDPQ